ncbi:hypothetical protein N9891_01570 [bacterium]|nr:hypothetical protein [bacterium]
MVVISVFCWRAGFENGFQEAEEQAAKRWEPLIASGWLHGRADNPHLWAPNLNKSAADFVSQSYKSKYEILMNSVSVVPESSRSKWLVENHASSTRLTPDEFDEILRKYVGPDEGGEAPPEPNQNAEQNGAD